MKANCRLALHLGAASSIVVLSFNLAGDGLHDALKSPPVRILLSQHALCAIPRISLATERYSASVTAINICSRELRTRAHV